MSVRTVEFLSDLFLWGRPSPAEREVLLKAFASQISGPDFNPARISTRGRVVLERLVQRKAFALRRARARQGRTS